MRTSLRRSVFSAALAAACGSSEPPPAAPQGPTPRPDDPKLEHSWKMSADASALASADLGTKPPEAAAALMEGGRMPSIAHRVAQACATSGAAKGLAAVALRFHIGDDGKVADVEADPVGPAGTCFADALAREAGTFEDVTASAALLRIELHGK